MAVLSGGEVGLDEGGIAQAVSDAFVGLLASLDKPIVHVEDVKTRTSKKGRVKTTTSTIEITGTQILVLAAIYGLLNIRDILPGGIVDAAGDAAAGAGSWFKTQTTYGLGFHYKWRGMNHDKRAKWREEHGKAAGWMPPGYPGFWD